jgi:predicted dehydrogenase
VSINRSRIWPSGWPIICKFIFEENEMSFRIAVIGCGQIALSHHGPAYQKYVQDYPGAELAACCDLSAEKAESFGKKFGFTNWYTHWEEMVEREHPDAICLNVLPAQTGDLTCSILHIGIPLMLEKPPGMTGEEIDQMIRCAEITGTPNQVAFNRRYMPLLARLRAMLSERFSPGEIQHLTYDFCRMDRTDPDFSTTAVHGIDATRFIIGSDYETIRFHYREFPQYGPSVADFLMDCTFKSGATAQLNFCPLAGLVIERAEVHAHGHSFFLRTPIWCGFDYPGNLMHVENGTIIEEINGIDLSGSKEDFILNGFYQEDTSFFEDIRHGRRPEGNIASGRQSVVIAQAIRERRQELHFA